MKAWRLELFTRKVDAFQAVEGVGVAEGVAVLLGKVLAVELSEGDGFGIVLIPAVELPDTVLIIVPCVGCRARHKYAPLSFLMSHLPLGCFLWCFKSVPQCNTGGCTVGVHVDEIITKTLAVDIGGADHDVIMLVIRVVMPGNNIWTFRNIGASRLKVIEKISDDSPHLIASGIRHRAEQGCFFGCEGNDDGIALQCGSNKPVVRIRKSLSDDRICHLFSVFFGLFQKIFQVLPL